MDRGIERAVPSGSLSGITCTGFRSPVCRGVAQVWSPNASKPLALGHWQLEALRLEGISNVSISDIGGMSLLPIGNMLRKTRRDNIDYSPMRQPSGQRSSVARPCKSASLSNVDSPIRALTLRNRRRNKGERRMLEHSQRAVADEAN